ncbi:fibronectin type-III domain-containing protein 3A-like isoform X1 [Branchiostoma lanceolatum]|uniref:fibronectin type-III domain-containing protein 3A-like isoform X1 n=1 Tax=Branchiostoma lanceolatum TaxID=7740 RepID=UPI003454E3CA
MMATTPKEASPPLNGPMMHPSMNGSAEGPHQVFYLHVAPGQMYTIATEDGSMQQVQGPATVCMVSHDGTPPIPPEHIVQQVMDANGSIHIMTALPPPQYPNVPHQMGYPPPSHMPHHMFPQNPYHPPDGGGEVIPPQYTPHPYQPSYPYPPEQEPQRHTPNFHKIDERAEKTRDRLRNKLHTRQRDNCNASSPPTSPRRSQPSSPTAAENGFGRGGGKRRLRNSCSQEPDPHMGNHQPNSKDSLEVKRIKDILSSIQKPQVHNVEARSVKVSWSPPPLCMNGSGDPGHNHIDQSHFCYELVMSDKGKDGNFKVVYSGEKRECSLTDLRPGSEYHISVYALSDNIKGMTSEVCSFRTLTAPPETPAAPKLSNRTKNSLALKWMSPSDNGSKITCFILEWDEGKKGNGFREVYSGPQKIYKATKLTHSTCYTFRLAAQNDVGKSDFSPEVYCHTSGSPPPAPEPPKLVRATTTSLQLHWTKPAGADVEAFILEMEDEDTGYGFQPVYNGDDLTYTHKRLRRNSSYYFRLCASNSEGRSGWSEKVTFSTNPEKPGVPSRPQLKGRLHAQHFKISWDPPRDTGGTDITKYVLEMSSGKDGPYEVVYTGSNLEHTCDNLVPGGTYKLRVACVGAGGQSQYSESYSITTLPVIPGQCHPPKLCGKPKANSLQIKWAPPDYDGGSPPTEYLVDMVMDDCTSLEVYKGPEMECTIINLLPGRTYAFRVKAFNRVGGGPVSEPSVFTTGAGPPDAPSEPVLTCKAPTAALVSWQMPAGNGAEVVEYRLEWNCVDGTFSQLYAGQANSYEVKGLSPASYYYFRVQAVNSAGVGPFSPVATCQTPASSPSAVTTFQVVADETPENPASSLHLEWDEPCSNGEDILGYNIDIGLEGRLVAVELPVTDFILEGLLPDTTYRLRIQAVNRIGAGPFSATIKARTKPLPPNPPKLECVQCGHSSLKLRWTDGTKNADTKATEYILQMEDTRTLRFVSIYAGTNTNFKVNRLSEQTPYNFRILATNDAGEGPFSPIYQFITQKAPPPAMKAPKVQEVTDRTCKAVWMEVPAMRRDPILYQLQMAQGREARYQEVYKGPETSFTLQNLEPDTEYHLRVCSVRQCQDDPTTPLVGPYSPGLTFHTRSKEQVVMETPRPVQEQPIERKELSDEQLVAIILASFTLLAIFIAFIIQYFI